MDASGGQTTGGTAVQSVYIGGGRNRRITPRASLSSLRAPSCGGPRAWALPAPRRCPRRCLPWRRSRPRPRSWPAGKRAHRETARRDHESTSGARTRVGRCARSGRAGDPEAAARTEASRYSMRSRTCSSSSEMRWSFCFWTALAARVAASKRRCAAAALLWCCSFKERRKAVGSGRAARRACARRACVSGGGASRSASEGRVRARAGDRALESAKRAPTSASARSARARASLSCREKERLSRSAASATRRADSSAARASSPSVESAVAAASRLS